MTDEDAAMAALGNVASGIEPGFPRCGWAPSACALASRSRRRRASPWPLIPATAFIRAVWSLGSAGERRSDLGARIYRPAPSSSDLGPRAIRGHLARAAGQDDDDAFALIWNPEG